MQQDETFVQISNDSLEHFLAAIGPNKTLERGMRLKLIEGEPDLRPTRSAPRYDSDRKPQGERKSFGDRKYQDRNDDRPRSDDRPSTWEKPKRDKPAARRKRRRSRGFRRRPKKKFGRKPGFAGDRSAYQDRPPADRPGKDWGKPPKPARAGDEKPKRKKKSNG